MSRAWFGVDQRRQDRNGEGIRFSGPGDSGHRHHGNTPQYRLYFEIVRGARHRSLVDEHKVNLDTPIIKYLPDWRLSDSQLTRTVALRQLLSHTSGLPSDEKWPRQVPPTRHEVIGEFATMPITTQLGTKFQYCSRCVVLAADVLERMADQTWETYTRSQIFAPLGMSSASFGPLGLERATDAARPYRYEAVFGQTQVPWERLDYLGPLGPAGGIDASVTDMARYAPRSSGFGSRWSDAGIAHCRGAARTAAYSGTGCCGLLTAGCPRLASIIRIRCAASALSPEARAGCGNPARPDLSRGLWATMIPTRTPLKIFNGTNRTRSKPKTLFHVFGRQTFCPAAFSGSRKILEWELFDLQTTEAIYFLSVVPKNSTRCL
jgi:hypothetical protein